MSFMKCGHCGNDRDMKEVAKGSYNEWVDPGDDIGFRLEGQYYAVVKHCPRCEEISLYKYDDANYYDEDQYTLTLLYPRPRDVSFLPPRVRVAYEKAQKVKSVDASFYALGLRRVIELVCIDRGATKKSLNDQITELVANNSLPQIFAGMSHYLRDLGNASAHGKDVEVEQSDVEAATDFVEAILEYLYISPAKLKRVADELAARRAADTGESDQAGT